MDKIKEAQYSNLRKCFNENLIKPILGEGYYNMAMDVYTCDEQTTLDLKRRYDIKNGQIEVFKALFTGSLLLNMLLILYELFYV